MASIGRAVGRKFIARQPIEHKRIDGTPAPIVIGHLGRWWVLDFLVGPVRFGAGVNLCIGQLVRHIVASDFQLRIKRRTQLDPLREDVDLRLRQLGFGRHLVIAIAIGKHIKQQALLGLLEIDGRPNFAARKQPLSAGEAKLPLKLLLPTVALKAIILEYRVNFLIEKLNLCRVGQLLCRQHHGHRQHAH